MKSEEELTKELILTLGKSIRARRLQKDWSIEELAGRSNLSHTHVGKIERGEQHIGIMTLYKLAVGLDLKSPSELLTDTNHYVYPNIKQLAEKWK